MYVNTLLFFCFMVQIPLYFSARFCERSTLASWVSGVESSSGGLGPVCAGFVTTEAAPYIKLSNETALAYRHGFHRFKVNAVC